MEFATVRTAAQRMMLRVNGLARYMVLRRQLAEVARGVSRLSTADQRALAVHVHREFELSARQSREASTTNAGFARSRSSNARVRLLGMAQWITSAFRETEQAEYPEMTDIHRQIMRLMRILRQTAGGLVNAA
jgi:hypothetical protein